MSNGKQSTATQYKIILILTDIENKLILNLLSSKNLFKIVLISSDTQPKKNGLFIYSFAMAVAEGR